MRYVISILIFFLVFSCKPPKETIKDSDVWVTDSISTVDSTRFNYPQLKEDTLSVGVGSGHNNTLPHVIIKNNEVPRSTPNVTTNTDTIQNNQYNFGYITYYIPDTMKVGQSYRIELRISKYNTVELSIGLDTNRVQRNIRIGSKMEAKLIDVDNVFRINSTNTPEQTVEMDKSYTTWVWHVVPLKAGRHELKLLVTIKQNDIVKDVPVYEDKVYVQASPIFTIWGFIKENWHYILGTLGACFTWWYTNMRRKRRKSR